VVGKKTAGLGLDGSDDEVAVSTRKAVRTIASSRLTAKGRVMVPVAVRKRLHLKAGDTIIFEESQSGVRIRKAKPLDAGFLSALESTLSEWNSKDDERGYRSL